MGSIPFKLSEKYPDIYNSNQTLHEVYDDIDSYGFLSENLALELEKLLKYKDFYYIGIHRCGIQSAESILESGGIRITGHLSSGAPIKKPISVESLELNISFYDSLLMLVRELKLAGKYKTINNSSDALICMIPKNLDIDSLVYEDNLFGYVLRNDYIYGYVHVDNGVVSEMIYNKQKLK